MNLSAWIPFIAFFLAAPQAKAVAPAPTPRFINPMQFGLKAGGDPKANRLAIRAALAAVDADKPANGDNLGAKVLLPPGDFAFDRPISVYRPNTAIIGAGPTLTRLSWPAGHDGLALGFDPAPGGVALKTTNFVDLFGVLDASAAPASRKRFGLRTFGTTHLRGIGSPLDQGMDPRHGVGAGDGYAGATALTLDLAVDFSRCGAGNVSICGLQEHGQGRPFYLLRIGGQLWFFVVTDDGRVGRGTQHVFVVTPAAPLAGLSRVTVQLDLASGTFAAWIDGVQRPAPLNAGQGPPLTPGSKLLANQHTPYGIGEAVNPIGGKGDLTFLGHKLTAAPLYKVGKAGDAQARLDGKPINDALRYFVPEPKLVGLLPLDDAPADVIADRIVSVANGSRRSMYWLDDRWHSDLSGTPGLRPVEGVGVRATGNAVSLGMCWGLRLRDCDFMGGSRGVGSLAYSGAWPVQIADCTLWGNDAPIYLNSGLKLSIERVTLNGDFRAGMRLMMCDGSVKGVFSPSQAKFDFGLKLDRCAMLIDDVGFDCEAGGSGPQVAFVVYLSAGSEQPSYAVRLSQVGASAGAGPGSAFLMLDTNEGDAGRPNRVTMTGCPVFDVTRRAVVLKTGGNWIRDIAIDSPTTRAPKFSGFEDAQPLRVKP